MPTKDQAQPPSEKKLTDEAEEAEDNRIAAEEASEIADEDDEVVTDAREERVP